MSISVRLHVVTDIYKNECYPSHVLTIENGDELVEILIEELSNRLLPVGKKFSMATISQAELAVDDYPKTGEIGSLYTNNDAYDCPFMYLCEETIKHILKEYSSRVTKNKHTLKYMLSLIKHDERRKFVIEYT